MFAPLVYSLRQTGQVLDPIHENHLGNQHEQSNTVIDGFDSERTLSRPNAHKPAGYLAAAATRGCKRALLALSGPLPLASARCDACFSHSHLRPSPRRDGLHSDAAVPNPCALVDRWRAATLQPARRPCCSALVIPLRTPFARRSPFVLHGLAVAEHGSLLTAFSLGGPSPRRRSFITCGRWHRGTSPRCVLSALPSWQCAVCTAAAALPRSRITVMLGLVSRAVLTFITCAGVTFAPATHARKTIAPIGGFYLNYSRSPASRTEDRHGSSTITQYVEISRNTIHYTLCTMVHACYVLCYTLNYTPCTMVHSV